VSDLLGWAEHEFYLNQPDDKGITAREHLEQVEKQTGVKPEALRNPHKFPRLLHHIWSAFLRLNSARTSGFSGPNPLTYTEMKAWQELTRTPLQARDFETIKRLDGVYMRVANG